MSLMIHIYYVLKTLSNKHNLKKVSQWYDKILIIANIIIRNIMFNSTEIQILFPYTFNLHILIYACNYVRLGPRLNNIRDSV